ncbi:fungal-specific transcription factor domain-containing protein [Abortiporus biennis]|nr:fungal-specific transcription factor domain-containing protein [Abortiporus biennis]
MPQAARGSAKSGGDDKPKEGLTKAQEQEFKRARGAISCAECRRLKLKCDKTVPCASCKRRGCASICPNGSLTTGQGTRFILADTDRLHRKIGDMSDRIRQLEDALSISHSATAHDTHPLLRRELLGVKSVLELHAATHSSVSTGSVVEQVVEEDTQFVDTFGTLAVREDGASTFYGRSAGTESLLLDEHSSEELSQSHSQNGLASLHPALDRLTFSFPAAPSVDIAVADIMQLMEEYLPPWPRAAQLCDLYLEQAPWFFGAITRRQLVEEALPMFYTEAAAAAGMTSSANVDTGIHQVNSAQVSPGSSGGIASSTVAFNLQPGSTSASSHTASAHDLGLIFVVFCFGALTDPDLPAAPHNMEASRYYQLTRAALALEPVLDRPPSVVTVQTLSLMAIYQGLVADENSIESTWALMGLSSRLAQSIGLHRDCSRWKLSPYEVQKRRALFWEIFITDCWQSLATGRLATFSLPFVDAELPSDPDQTIAEDGTPQPSFPAWKAKFGKECVSAVVENCLTTTAPKYSVILDVDRKIRDMELPKYAQADHAPKGVGLGQTMSYFMPKNYRDLTLLYVHRSYFARALSDFPTEPMRSPFAPSFLAGYRSACSLLGGIREQFSLFPVQIARFWVLWTHAFSAAVMLGSVVTHGPATKIAQAALSELRSADELFQKATEHGGRAIKFSPIVHRLYEKAYVAFTQGLQRKDIFSPRDPEGEKHDELSIFSGRTRTVATKSPKSLNNTRSMSQSKQSPHSSQSSPSHLPSPMETHSSRSSQSPHGTPQEGMSGTPPTLIRASVEAYGNSVHPMLIDQMRALEGQLETQISSVDYYNMNCQSTTVESTGGPSSSYISPPSLAPYEPSYENPPPPSNAPWPSPPSEPRQQAHIAPPPGPPPTYHHQQQQQHYSHVLQEHPSVHSMPMFGGVENIQQDVSPQASSHGYQDYHQQPQTHVRDQHMYSQVPHDQQEQWNTQATELVYTDNGHQYAEPVAEPLERHHSQPSYQPQHPYPHHHQSQQQQQPQVHTHHSYHAPAQTLHHQQHYPPSNPPPHRTYSHHESYAPPPTAPPVMHSISMAQHQPPDFGTLQETWTSFMQQELPIPGNHHTQQQQLQQQQHYQQPQQLQHQHYQQPVPMVGYRQ